MIQSTPSRLLARDVATAVLFFIASSRCAVYENGLTDGPRGGEGTSGEHAEGGKLNPNGASGTSGAASGGRPNGGSTGVAGSSGSVEPGEAGAGGAEGGAPSEGGQAPIGGLGGAGDTGGTGMGGMGGMTGVETLLSLGKAATSDSEQTSQDHLASHANDGDTSTRWCAANNALNHYWHVDLGESHTLTKVHLLWEKDFAYLFKIETSADDTNWFMAIDKTISSSATASQDHALPANTNGRYVRLTVTGGVDATTWASLYEVQIFGY